MATTNANFRLKIKHKIVLIGLLGLLGLLALGGIGYLSNTNLKRMAVDCMATAQQVRQSIISSYDQALASEGQARQLINLNQRLIELMDLVTTGPHKGITAEQIMVAARQLTKDAAIINQAPGAERLVAGTRNSIGKVTINNFADVETLLEFELPELYSLIDQRAEFQAKQGDIVLAMGKMYYFIARNLEELAGNSLAEVTASKRTLSQTLTAADAETEAIMGRLKKTAERTSFGLLTVFALTLAVLGVIFSLFARSITRPLHDTVEMARALRSGQVSARLTMVERGDEFGSMARALNQFADDLEHEVVAAMQQLANGDFNIDIQPSGERDLVRGALQRTAAKLNETMGEILCASDQIASGSEQVADSAQQLSQGASTAAASLEEISASMNEMTGQIKLSADNAAEADQFSSAAKTAAETGNQKMQQMVEAMVEIKDAGQGISRIIKVIDEIAFQTNLLALNAAVEAARAGHHGKGFAVVAEEVRNLAARSAKAASETTALIQSSVSKTENGVTIATETAQSLAAIVGDISKVSTLVGAIASASKEQATGISQVNIGLGQIDQVIQTNTASAEESAATSEQLSAQAARLNELLTQFSLKQHAGGNQAAAAVLPRGVTDF